MAGEISGSIRYAMGSAGWKMLKSCSHLGEETVMDRMSSSVGLALLLAAGPRKGSSRASGSMELEVLASFGIVRPAIRRPLSIW